MKGEVDFLFLLLLLFVCFFHFFRVLLYLSMLHLLNIDKWKKVALVIVYCQLDIGHLSIWNNAMIYLNDDRQTEVNFIESAIYEQYHFLQIQLMRMLELL